uniref:Uncharacterized protein n=1 Tax=Candidatus Kentrum sp. LFY TaxID=2126342 RepID=A0A450UI02_9GAMM|nr:MAG: hypothetical protein BECKLFY1418A_GA0070994_10217 [Candidatus Kentron sp. LFY]
MDGTRVCCRRGGAFVLLLSVIILGQFVVFDVYLRQRFGITFTCLPSREADPIPVVVTNVGITGGTLETPVVIERSTIPHRYASHPDPIRRTEPDQTRYRSRASN